MLKYYIKITEALKSLRADQDGVVSFEYIIVAVCIVGAVGAVFGGGAGGQIGAAADHRDHIDHHRFSVLRSLVDKAFLTPEGASMAAHFLNVFNVTPL